MVGITGDAAGCGESEWREANGIEYGNFDTDGFSGVGVVDLGRIDGRWIEGSIEALHHTAYTTRSCRRTCRINLEHISHETERRAVGS